MKARKDSDSEKLSMMMKRANKQLKQRTCKPIAKHAAQTMAKKVLA